MLTKFYLQIDDTSIELTNACVKNWDEITCAYARKDYDGVVRSFTSQFEFVGEAYDLLLQLYLKNGVKADATISVYTITNRWKWEKRFDAPLDFSTISWTATTLTISSVDNSLTAKIKARKSTTYEFVVGQDIVPDNKLNYDRMIMQNTVLHELMSNTDEKYNDGSITLAMTKNMTRLYVYSVGDAETYENSPITFSDQSDDTGSYFLKVVRSANLQLTIDLTYNGKKSPLATILKGEIHLMSFLNAGKEYSEEDYTDLGKVFEIDEIEWNGSTLKYIGCFPSYEALVEKHTNPSQGCYALIGTSNNTTDVEACYYTPYSNGTVEWTQGGYTSVKDGRGRDAPFIAVCQIRRYIMSFNLSNVPSGTMLALLYKMTAANDSSDSLHEMANTVFGMTSEIKTSWESRATTVQIDALSPANVLARLMEKITDGEINVTPHISIYDSRLANTYLLAAESIRAIDGGKFYSSFNNFCDWMEAVFGYVYYVGEVSTATFTSKQYFDTYYDADTAVPDYEDAKCDSDATYEICLFAAGPTFLAYNTDEDKYYARWAGWESYKSSDGTINKDVLFVMNSNLQPYYLNDANTIEPYKGNIDSYDKVSQDIYFVHRAELFSAQTPIEIEDAKDLEYCVDDSLLYSAIEVGYEKQDYDAQCGRDEWNFTNEYNTGIDVSSSTLSLISKYRADCYGMEFLTQKRGDDDSDSDSDNDVFFVYTVEHTDTEEDEDGNITETKSLVLGRTVTVEGALSDTVFNGEYSPRACLLANKDYIGAMYQGGMHVTFASSDGNSDVSIDGVPQNSDIDIDTSLFTCGLVTFTTGDTDAPTYPDSLYQASDNYLSYIGFLSEVKIKFAKSAAVTYTLIVKNISSL